MKGLSTIGVVVAIVVIVVMFALLFFLDTPGWLNASEGRSRPGHVIAIILAAATILLGISLTAGVYS